MPGSGLYRTGAWVVIHVVVFILVLVRLDLRQLIENIVGQNFVTVYFVDFQFCSPANDTFTEHPVVEGHLYCVRLFYRQNNIMRNTRKGSLCSLRTKGPLRALRASCNNEFRFCGFYRCVNSGESQIELRLQALLKLRVIRQHSNRRIHKLNKAFGLCLFVLRFYGPVNPMGSCRARSVYLTTRLLGRLSPLSG